MHKIVIDRYGPPSVMRMTRCPDPSPGDNEVLVEVAAAGVNFIDVYQRSGIYSVRFPWTPGIEGSGTVLRCGAGVTGVTEGDRVAWTGCPGSYATRCLIPASRLVPLPDAIALTDAAAALIQGMTAHFLASDVVPLDEVDTCLVHAAAGGVGGLLCQLAAMRGAMVIGTVSHAAKAQAAREAGAAHVIDYSRHSFAQEVAEITGRRGVDVVYDAVGRDTVADGLNCLRPRGTFVLYGQTSGPADPIDPQVLNARGSLFFTKPSLTHYDTTPALVLRRAREVLGLLEQGRLRLRIHDIYQLEDAAAAHEALESRAVLGKVILQP